MTQYNVMESTRLIGGCIEKSQDSYFTLRKKNQRFELNKNHKIAFLKRGTISLYHATTHKVILIIEGPGIIGIEQLFKNEQPYCFRCEQDCEIVLISEDSFINLLTCFNYWEHAANLLCNHLGLFFNREELLNHKSNKDIVREHLKLLWAQDESFRIKTSIYKFIISRHKISRSSLHNIIGQLTDENIVKTQRGKLIWMNVDDSSVHEKSKHA
ncbi:MULTISPECIES: helix-turn-helix domain-containing protein [Enterobacter]|uniref:helix-turn-helix domain-containing protein n=1 Tax=Enterobacter TaxID=547 RepID=UPI001BDE4C18|nr:helix-turn-helix domain-containing protein [Enterobacter asburiae]MBT1866624.1 helix-turn-helix domain-containing protein [Enterobacter asburiae]MBT1893708.1 helix-turn-helix domain-containing protein [Enterobacter asburiae]